MRQRLAILPLLALLTACADNRPFYQQPAYLTPYNAATLSSGTVHLFLPPVLAIQTAITAVDNQRTTTQQVLITPGPHQVEFQAAIWAPTDQQAAANVTLTGIFDPGQTYLLLTSNLLQADNLNDVHAWAWIVNSAGNPVSPAVMAQFIPANSPPAPDPVYIPEPYDAGGGGYAKKHDHDRIDFAPGLRLHLPPPPAHQDYFQAPLKK